MNASSLKARFLLLGFLFAIFLKFWLIWESEIVDASDDPHEYVLQILYPANGGVAYGPGTGLIGRLFYDIGLPFRLGIEGVFLLATVLVLRALFAWPWKSRLSLGLFLFVTFDPAVVELFSHLFSDEVWLVEVMIGLSCIVLALQREARPNWILLNLAALFLGLSTLTRSVFIPLAMGLVMFFLIAFILILLKDRKRNPGARLGALTLSLASLFFVIGIIHEGTCFYNFRCYGYNGISAIDCSQYKKFYFCLQSVGDPTGQRYFPIDADRRALIAEAGPNSKRFMAEMDPSGFFKEIGLKNYGTADIAAGWLEFAIFDDAYQAAHGDLRKCYALFATIEDEIAESNRRGLLKVRPVIPLPDSRISILAAAYPGAVFATVREIAHEPAPSALTWDRDRRYDDHDFTVALNRRVVHESPVRDQIWGPLCGIYACLYPPLVCAYLAVFFGFFTLVITKWKRIGECSPSWLAQQLFGLFFLVWIAWYALFAASGWPALSRYMIFNHVLLPILLAYYLSAIMRLLRDNHL